MSKRGRPKKIGEEQHEVLRQIVADRPSLTLSEISRELAARTGIKTHEVTVRKALRAAGLRRVRGEAAVERQTQAPSGRYGYTAAHRRHDPDQCYPSCLTDAEWLLVDDLFAPAGGRGVPPRYPRRILVDACCYVVRTGCAWRMLPHDFPPWDNVYKTFRRWTAQGKFEQMHDRLRALWRAREGHDVAPSEAVLDAQSTRSSPQGGPSGYDAGKKVKGRKRSLVVDTLGLLLAVSVMAANAQDRDAAPAAVAHAAAKYPSVEKLYVDSAYAGQFAQTVEQNHGIQVEVVRHPANKTIGQWQAEDAAEAERVPVKANADGFVPLPKRWIVERTHAWNERARRLIMHHDRLLCVSEAWVWLTEARILLRRMTTTT
jgi:putative transposase